LQVQPELELIQFVDGDCRVVEGWLERAASELVTQPEVVVVCGRRREEFPDNSIYNRLFDIEWNTPIGETKSCGGDSMMKVSAFKNVGGFNPKLIAGEEPELCLRLRQAGGKILRIDAEMTLHDAQMTRFSQWWKRSIRSGYAFTEGAWLHGGSPERHWVRESNRIWLWAVFLPIFSVAGLLATRGVSILLLLMAHTFVAYRLYRRIRVRGFDQKEAIFYALFCAIEKYPQLLGKIQFYIFRFLKRQRTIVEYKSAPSAS
jgi:GT2 family glycosyltransferase